MTELTYAPKQRTGFTCEIEIDDQPVFTLERAPDESGDRITGDRSFTTNEALIDLVTGFGTDENFARRTRKPGETDRLREQSDDLRKDATFLADLISALGDETERGWCSSCFGYATHRTSATGRLKGNAFICESCGAATKKCSVTRCPNFAIRSSSRFALKSCAEHSHAIPSFERADEHLDDFTQVADWLTPTRRNAKRTLIKAGAFLGTAAVTAPLAFVAAPAIGGIIGGWGTGLTGAAASSHGLAILGGGTLASGGAGMVGGTMVVTAVGSSLLGAKGVAVASAYTSEDRSFAFELVREGDGPTVIFATGFLTEGADPWAEWRPIIEQRVPSGRVYRLRWGSKELRDLLGFAGDQFGAAGATSFAAKVAAKATKIAPKALGAVAAADAATDITKNPWHVARRRAQMTGAALASIIGHVDESPVILMGHSLGGLVMASAADALGSGDLAPRVSELHLLGAAVDDDQPLSRIAAAVDGTVFNYWSSKDKVLSLAYRAAQLNQKAAGSTGFTERRAGVKNVNVSKQVSDHSAYVPNVTLKAS
ncbi:MAG: DUF726 domain-containing protein [Actinomycetota bacterium]